MDDRPFVTDEGSLTPRMDAEGQPNALLDLFGLLRQPDKAAGRLTDGPMVSNPAPLPDEALSWRTRQWLWEHSTIRGVRRCGRVRSASEVSVRTADGVASLVGLTTCRSPWACPTCWRQHSVQTRSEIHNAIARWTASGGRVAFVSLSLSRRQNRHLEPVWDLMAEAWDRIIRSQMWQKWMTDLGSPGWIKTIQVTYDKGWTPTVELVLFVGQGTSGRSFTAFKQWLCAKWIRQFDAMGSPRPAKGGQNGLLVDRWGGVNLATTMREHMHQVVVTAVRISMARSGGQISPPRAGRGVVTADPTTKAARHDSVWHLLVGAVAGDGAMATLWQEFEQTTQNRRPIIWSHGLKDTLNGLVGPAQPVAVSKTTPSITCPEGSPTASDYADTPTIAVDEVVIPGPVWDHLVRTKPEVIEPMLAAAASGPSALRAFLTSSVVPRVLHLGVPEH